MRRHGLGLDRPLAIEQVMGGGLARAVQDAGSLTRMANPLGDVLAGLRLQTHALDHLRGRRTLIEQFSSPSYLTALRTGFETSALVDALGSSLRFTSLFERDAVLWGTQHEWVTAFSVLGRSWDRHLSLFESVALDYDLERPVEVTVRAWSDVVDRATDDPAQRVPDRLAATGRAAVGVLAAGAALLEDDEEQGGFELDDEEEGLLSRDGLSTALRQELRTLHPHLPARLDAAWAQVAAADPSAPSLAAHALMELIDWSLRIAAPDEAVLAWHASHGRPPQEVVEGRPTRTLRARYVLQDRQEDQTAARLFIRGLNDIVGQIQRYKHAIDVDDGLAVARLIPTVEGILIYLFV